MRKPIPVLADLYPAGEETCSNCGSENLPGERFYTIFNLFSSHEKICPDCHEIEKRVEKERERQSYIDGEEPWGTDEIVCPWCGYEQLDSWEMPDSDDECECNECGKLFAYERDIQVTYSSERVEENQ